MHPRVSTAVSASLAAILALIAVGGCERRPTCTGDYCGTLVFITGNNPDILNPAVSDNTGASDVEQQVFLKLADVGMSGNTVGDQDFVPELAQRWEWEGPRSLVFHLDPRARWHDGRAVTAGDVEFSFDAYADTAVNSPARESLRRIASVRSRDSLTIVFTFSEAYPEMFYDAVYHMQILPRHLLAEVPRTEWRSSAFGRNPVGDGPYRFVSWVPNQAVELAADSTFFLGRPHIRRLIWHFAANLQVAVTQLVADQADALEYLGPPQFVQQAQAAPQLTLHPYKGSNYGYLGFNLRANGDTTQPHPIFGDRSVRRALSMGVDRGKLLQSVFGTYAKVPPGPMPQFWSIWDSTIRTLPYDPAAAAGLLAAHGWRMGPDSIRVRDGQKLSFHLLVVTTSNVRQQYARLLQEQLRPLGVDLQIDALEQNALQQRLAAGKYDAVLEAWQASPTPSSGITQLWTSHGATNFSHYANADFDDLVTRATSGTTTRESAARLWRGAMDVLNADAPGIWLFAPDNVAAVHKRVADVQIRPDSWWALVRAWRIPADRLIDRDRAGR
jgi:peptide/nickel transport system substrate-binding protein